MRHEHSLAVRNGDETNEISPKETSNLSIHSTSLVRSEKNTLLRHNDCLKECLSTCSCAGMLYELNNRQYLSMEAEMLSYPVNGCPLWRD